VGGLDGNEKKGRNSMGWRTGREKGKDMERDNGEQIGGKGREGGRERLSI
jgi:hypothetical protein